MADSIASDQQGDQPAVTTPTGAREELQKNVKQQIMLSIGLNFEEKGELIEKLPSLSEDQLKQLSAVFDEENKRKEQLLGEFFSKHPDLYPEFERFSKDHVTKIYHNVEEDEKTSEESRMQELLTTSF